MGSVTAVLCRNNHYSWLHAAQEGNLGERKRTIESPRKTPAELAQMIWESLLAYTRRRAADRASQIQSGPPDGCPMPT